MTPTRPTHPDATIAAIPSMPRRLAIELLHLAQIHGDRELAGLVSCRSDVPHRFYLLCGDEAKPQASEDDWRGAMARMAERDERPWAVFTTFPGLPRLPVDGPAPFARHLLHLTISLSVKGVLQMGGWWYVGRRWIEQDLKMLEAEET